MQSTHPRLPVYVTFHLGSSVHISKALEHLHLDKFTKVQATHLQYTHMIGSALCSAYLAQYPGHGTIAQYPGHGTNVVEASGGFANNEEI